MSRKRRLDLGIVAFWLCEEGIQVHCPSLPVTMPGTMSVTYHYQIYVYLC